MKKKTIITLIIILFVAISAFGIYENYENILNYLNNKEWELTESVGSTSIGNFYAIDGTSSNLLVVGNNYILGYSDNAKESFDESVSLMSAITDANGEFCIIGEKDGSKVYMINTSTKVWETDIQGSILDVSVNKNGYSAIVYKQTGYKSLIKVLKPDGEELFTSYLASTYAIEVEISNDNKSLAIAELNTDGIKIQSAIKFIDINNIDQENVKKISLEDDILITDIEYTNKNQLLVLTDKNAQIILNGSVAEEIVNFNNDVNYATVENSNYVVSIEKAENGLFEVKYLLNIYEYEEGQVNKKEYELNSLPLIMTASNKNIAMLFEDEFIVVNTNGKLVKRCEMNGNVKDICLFNDGNAVAIIFRDKIEFLKL